VAIKRSDRTRVVVCQQMVVHFFMEYRLRMLENMMLMRMFGSEREEVAGGWRRLHSKELHYSYTSPNVIGIIKSRGMR
jgi:hypothetical protein